MYYTMENEFAAWVAIVLYTILVISTFTTNMYDWKLKLLLRIIFVVQCGLLIDYYFFFK